MVPVAWRPKSNNSRSEMVNSYMIYTILDYVWPEFDLTLTHSIVIKIVITKIIPSHH
jgi:hypothetical protein